VASMQNPYLISLNHFYNMVVELSIKAVDLSEGNVLVVLELLKLLTGVKVRTHQNRMTVGVHGMLDQGVDDRS
jgi:hypothetical protein